ncbi:MAG: glycerol-3-phosphate 1-O-acyltransferase [Phycisphaerales bacterium]|nr:MAG: glycerol-3-phosphate 1-O-acyltransferase [Phycisphaerales bacterium]
MSVLLLAIPVAFLVGSIPFGFWIGRARGIDIRQHGSGNIGATNVGRVLGKKIGLLCFLLDVAKGLVPVLVAGWLAGVLGDWSPAPGLAWAWLAVVLASVAGHVFCPWVGFKGGKGVATGLGALLGVYPLVTLPAAVAFAFWFVLVAAFRYVGVASVVAAASVPVLVAIGGWALAPEPSVGGLLPFVVVTGLLAAIVIARHRGNITRTLAGTEPKVWQRTTRAG